MALRGKIGDATNSRPIDGIDNTHNSSAERPGGSSLSLSSRILCCGGACSIQALQPYFDVDTLDVFVRVKSTFKYLMVNDGFRINVLYLDDPSGNLLAYRSNNNNDASSLGDDPAAASMSMSMPPNAIPEGSDDDIASYDRARTAAVPSIRGLGGGKGPDLYGPVWVTLTLVFCAAVTSNMSLYLHHSRKNRMFKSSMIDEGGLAAEEEWEYDVNKLLHAMWILYGYSLGLPAMVYCALGMIGNSNNLRLVELICLYGYSLVPYLPVVWICILPYNWVQWTMLMIATIVSGLFVLRNVVGSIMKSGNGGYGTGGGSMHRNSGGGLIMCLVGCHLVFLLVVKLTFYHHVGLPIK